MTILFSLHTMKSPNKYLSTCIHKKYSYSFRMTNAFVFETYENRKKYDDESNRKTNTKNSFKLRKNLK